MKKNHFRHLFKSFTWRIIGTIDTFIVSFFISRELKFGLIISVIDFILKFIIYYFHERIWFNSPITSHNKRHFFKTISWRTIAGAITILTSWGVTGIALIGFKIGFYENFSKMILYYFHEKIWYRINFGLNKRKLSNAR